MSAPALLPHSGHPSSGRLRYTPAWAGMAVLALAVLALAASPPWLGFEGGALVRGAFAPLCHQMPDRSPHVHGVPFALCHRCTGIVAGLALGVVLGPLMWVGVARRLRDAHPLVVLGLFGLPTFVDWTVGATGVLANTGLSRMVTGGLFGVGAGLLLVVAVCVPPRSSHSLPVL